MPNHYMTVKEALENKMMDFSFFIRVNEVFQNLVLVFLLHSLCYCLHLSIIRHSPRETPSTNLSYMLLTDQVLDNNFDQRASNKNYQKPHTA